jgi:small subunit ribosomal protein S5
MENVKEVEVVATEQEQQVAPATSEQPKRSERRPDRRNRRPRENNNREDDGLIKKLVEVRRVTKVVKGGRTMRFSALVVLGDGKGRVGVGVGKAAEVPQAIEKATQQAKRAMVTIALKDTTIPHEVIGTFGRGKVLLMPAETGTGVIAGGPARNVLEAVGIKDIRTKSYGSNNKINCVKATFNGLVSLRSAEHIAQLRGKTVEEIL